MEEFGIKELYDIAIKATQPIEFCGRMYEPGETLIFLERAQFGVLNEVRYRVFARGGKENRRFIMWDTTQPVQMQIQQGVISKENLSGLTNNFLTEKIEQSIPFRKTVAPNAADLEDDYIELELPYQPNTLTQLFLYDQDNNKIPKTDYGITQDYKKLLINNTEDYRKIESFIVDSYFSKETEVLNIGKNALRGYLKLEARTRVKDDIDGYEKTGIFVIPKMRIMSDLSIRLGDSITPFVYGFSFEGEPVGPYGESRVCDLYFLDEDLDADNLV
jgi:hypothetical protein